MLIPKCSSFFGPTHNVPFGNSVHYTAVVFVYLYMRVFLNQAGFYHTFCPSEPRTTYLPQFIKSGIMSIRILDGLTDMAFARVLIREVLVPTYRASTTILFSDSELPGLVGALER